MRHIYNYTNWARGFLDEDRQEDRAQLVLDLEELGIPVSVDRAIKSAAITPQEEDFE
jgi:hypothetical protein